MEAYTSKNLLTDVGEKKEKKFPRRYCSGSPYCDEEVCRCDLWEEDEQKENQSEDRFSKQTY